MGDVNVKVGCDETGGIVNKWGVPRVNENRCYLVDVFVEMGLFLSIAFFFFPQRMIHWGMMKEKSKGFD